MSDRFLTIATLTSITGLILLTIASEHLYPPTTNIGDISTDLLDKNVHIESNACNVHQFSGGSIIVKLCDGKNELDLYLPYNVAQSINSSILEGKKLDVVGTVEVYQGRLEVVVHNPKHLKIK
jgi:DNA/RNA endonuclease YhcR with UshA esterase domain